MAFRGSPSRLQSRWRFQCYVRGEPLENQRRGETEHRAAEHQNNPAPRDDGAKIDGTIATYRTARYGVKMLSCVVHRHSHPVRIICPITQNLGLGEFLPEPFSALYASRLMIGRRA